MAGREGDMNKADAAGKVYSLSRILWWFTTGILLPVSIAFLAVAGGFVLFSEAQPDPDSIGAANKYDLMKDILSIVLGTAGAVIAILGVGTFFFLRNLVRQAAIDEVRQETDRHLVRLYGESGLSAWSLYKTLLQVAESTDPQGSTQLRQVATTWLTQAIHQTERALTAGGKLAPNKDITRAKNNLAWYLATRREAADCRMAGRLASELVGLIHTMSRKDQVQIDETITHVRQQCPAQPGQQNP